MIWANEGDGWAQKWANIYAVYGGKKKGVLPFPLVKPDIRQTTQIPDYLEEFLSPLEQVPDPPRNLGKRSPRQNEIDVQPKRIWETLKTRVYKQSIVDLGLQPAELIPTEDKQKQFANALNLAFNSEARCLIVIHTPKRNYAKPTYEIFSEDHGFSHTLGTNAPSGNTALGLCAHQSSFVVSVQDSNERSNFWKVDLNRQRLITQHLFGSDLQSPSAIVHIALNNYYIASGTEIMLTVLAPQTRFLPLHQMQREIVDITFVGLGLEALFALDTAGKIWYFNSKIALFESFENQPSFKNPRGISAVHVDPHNIDAGIYLFVSDTGNCRIVILTMRNENLEDDYKVLVTHDFPTKIASSNNYLFYLTSTNPDHSPSPAYLQNDSLQLINRDSSPHAQKPFPETNNRFNGPAPSQPTPNSSYSNYFTSQASFLGKELRSNDFYDHLETIHKILRWTLCWTVPGSEYFNSMMLLIGNVCTSVRDRWKGNEEEQSLLLQLLDSISANSKKENLNCSFERINVEGTHSFGSLVLVSDETCTSDLSKRLEDPSQWEIGVFAGDAIRPDGELFLGEVIMWGTAFVKVHPPDFELPDRVEMGDLCVGLDPKVSCEVGSIFRLEQIRNSKEVLVIGHLVKNNLVSSLELGLEPADSSLLFAQIILPGMSFEGAEMLLYRFFSSFFQVYKAEHDIELAHLAEETRLEQERLVESARKVEARLELERLEEYKNLHITEDPKVVQKPSFFRRAPNVIFRRNERQLVQEQEHLAEPYQTPMEKTIESGKIGEDGKVEIVKMLQQKGGEGKCPPITMTTVAKFIKITHNNKTIKVPLTCTPTWLKKRFELLDEPLSLEKADGTEVPFPLEDCYFCDGEETLLVVSPNAVSNNERQKLGNLYSVSTASTDNNAYGIFFDVSAKSAMTILSLSGRFYHNAAVPVQVKVWAYLGFSYLGKVASGNGWQLIGSEAFELTSPTQYFTICLNTPIPAGTTGFYIHCPEAEMHMCDSNLAGAYHPKLTVSSHGYYHHTSQPFTLGQDRHSNGYSFSGSLSFAIDE